MSFHVFWQKPFTLTHEIEQAVFILDSLKQYYSGKDDYCYCLMNAEFIGKDKKILGQYDIVVLTRHTVTIIELKSWCGKLIGTLSKNYDNTQLRFIFEEGKELPVHPTQVEKQKKHLLKKLDEYFRLELKKGDTDHYQIDCFLFFNTVDLTEYTCENDQIKRWFHISMRSTFLQDWQRIVHNGNFTITHGDACFIAERILLQKEADPNDYFHKLASVQERIASFKNQYHESPFFNFSFEMLRTEILERLTEEGLSEFLSLSSRIIELTEPEKVRFRELVEMCGIPYLSTTRIEHLFLNELMKITIKSFDLVANCFLEIPSTYTKRVSLSDLILLSNAKQIGKLRYNNTAITEQTINLLHQYDDFCHMNAVLGNKYIKSKEALEKGLFILQLFKTMEKKSNE